MSDLTRAFTEHYEEQDRRKKEKESYHDEVNITQLEQIESVQRQIKVEKAKEELRLLEERILKEKENKPPVAMRFTADKLRFDLLPIEALIELTRVYDSGALKYDDNNWRKGMVWSECIRPIFSHLFKWLMGQTVDKETGCHHLMMVCWNCITLFVYQLRKLGTDDRACLGFPVDDNFNWIDNHLNLGLSSEQKQELKSKYQQQREKAKC